ncbi:hypothetical protein KFK09_020791 [Dendrobium nobile]|uniref:Protein TIFY n=1 Tax=Dendrobium nobile TaxID=94219 RepID=A0A8T3AN75_DENNO|nr:hypothetical protein KFK09_020791 [Dendrobium nobile]
MERESFMAAHEVAVDPLELKLGSLGYNLSPSFPGADVTDSGHADSAKQLLEEPSRQITICYNGRISVCNVTNFQARAIMDMAKNEMEKNKYCKQEEDEVAIARETLELQPGLSMKRSLQRFLQKRKARLMADSSFPYAHRKPLQLF